MRLVYGIVISVLALFVACGDETNSTGSGPATGANGAGGSATGGNATGGNATGGSATGGNATGGSATGGNATGGNGTGGDATGGMGGGGVGGSGGTLPFVVTSPAFMDGATIPTAHTCDGANVSPELNWTPGPAGTLSYAMIHNDITFTFLHSAIWNIDPAAVSLPQGIENSFNPSNVPGALQCSAWDGTSGYSGPCPPSLHTYEYVIYALDVATLPGVDQNSSVAQVKAAADAAMLDAAQLTGTYGP